MTASLEALVEHWPGEHLLYVRALPGFMVAGEHLSELHRRSSAALQSHLDWLLERDLIDQSSGAIELNVVEEANATASAIGPRFMSDLIPPDAAEIESALAVGRAAVSDLIDAYEIASTNDSAESQAAALRRIAQHDDWCTSRLAGHVEHDTSSPPGEPVDLLVEAAGEFEYEVDRFAASAEPELFARDGEEWTLAKVLRRRTGFLRQHLFRAIETAERL